MFILNVLVETDLPHGAIVLREDLRDTFAEEVLEQPEDRDWDNGHVVEALGDGLELGRLGWLGGGVRNGGVLHGMVGWSGVAVWSDVLEGPGVGATNPPRTSHVK